MSDQNETPDTSTARKSRKPLLILAAAVGLTVLGYGIYYLAWGRFQADTDDAYVDGNVVVVAPQVAGTVVEFDTDDTELVTRGQTVAKLDDTDASIALQSAEASLGQAVRQISQSFATVRQLRAAVTDKEIHLKQADADFHRAQGLMQIQGISTQNFQHAREGYDSAAAGLAQARHQLAAAEAQVANTSLETHPTVRLMEAQVRSSYLALQRTRVIAPVTGYVAKRNVQLGQQVTPGTSLLAIIPLQQVWIDANYKETELADVRIGQPVRAESDLYGKKVVYTGHVVGLAPGTGTAFALLPAQNATGNWIKVVQRLPVRVALDPAALAKHPLRIGLSMDVSIDTHHRSGDVLALDPNQDRDDVTSVYADRSAGVENLIQTIIRKNAYDVPDDALAVVNH